MKVYSQTGEEDVLDTIFGAVGTTSQYLVDLGAGDGRTLSNTRLYLDRGWTGARFDLAPVEAEGVIGVRLTAENVCAQLAAAKVPPSFDLLSIDLDGIDWYVLRALLRGGYRPRVVCAEINGTLPAEPPVVVEYDPLFTFSQCNYYGGSLGAYQWLLAKYGYATLAVHQGLNAFWALQEILPPHVVPTIAFAPQPYWKADPQGRPWHTVTERDLP